MKSFIHRALRSALVPGAVLAILGGVLAGQAAGAPPLPPQRKALQEHARTHPGDPEQGRKLFFNVNRLACVSCHSTSGGRSRSGPDLAGLGQRSSRDEIISSVLEPSRVLVPGYQRVTIVTQDGQTVSGLLKENGPDRVKVQVRHRLKAVPWTEIEDMRVSPDSDMPEGLVDGLTPPEFADLIAFLESLRTTQVARRS
jgi:putative heme-binding domain-containing protein